MNHKFADLGIARDLAGSETALVADLTLRSINQGSRDDSSGYWALRGSPRAVSSFTREMALLEAA